MCAIDHADVRLVPVAATASAAGSVLRYAQQLVECGFRPVGYFQTATRSVLLQALCKTEEGWYAVIYGGPHAGVDLIATYPDGSVWTWSNSASANLSRPEHLPLHIVKTSHAGTLYQTATTGRSRTGWVIAEPERFVALFEGIALALSARREEVEEDLGILLGKLADDDDPDQLRAGEALMDRLALELPPGEEDVTAGPNTRRLVAQALAAQPAPERVIDALIESYVETLDDYHYHMHVVRGGVDAEHPIFSPAHAAMGVVLANVGPAGVACLERFVALLRKASTDGAPNRLAAQALGSMGPVARPALEALTEVGRVVAGEEYPNPYARAVADIAGDDPQWVAGLLRDARLAKPGPRQFAGEVLEMIGPRCAEQALPELVEAVTHDALDDGAPVIRALGAVGVGSEDAAHALLSLVRDERSGVRGLALEALGRIGRCAEQAVPAAIVMLDDDGGADGENAAIAAETLGRFGPAAAPAVEALIEHLHDADFGINLPAVKALGNIGPAAAPAVPQLEEFLRDADIAEPFGADIHLAIQSIRGEAGV